MTESNSRCTTRSSRISRNTRAPSSLANPRTNGISRSGHRSVPGFEAADGYLAVGIGSQKLWTEFCAAIDRADLATDDRFETNPDRVDHMDELEAELEATFRERPVEEWVSLLSDEHGLPVGPINDVADALENEHAEARGLLTEVDHPTAGDVPVVEHPLRFDRLESGFDDHAPVLGEDTWSCSPNAGTTTRRSNRSPPIA